MERFLKEIIHKSPPFEHIARNIQNKLVDRSAPTWSFIPNNELWSNTINTEHAEILSGIKEKIDNFRRSDQVTIIGGKTTGGSDNIFKFTQSRGYDELHKISIASQDDTVLIIYCPHPFWANLYQDYSWIPSWDELYTFFYSKTDWRILQYSTSFDPSGRYFFIVQKLPKQHYLCAISELSRKTYHVFYFKEGADLSLGRSNLTLSAHLCHALSRTGAKVFAHDLNDISALENVNQGDVLIGHVGPWVKEAAKRNIKDLILFNPANRWYPTRKNSLFEGNATIEEQVGLAKLVIAQSGMIWRMTCDYPDANKWRWIDLGVDQNLFPFVKKEFNLPGKRKFLFFHLYDERQKGADIANEIINNRSKDVFYWIGGTSVKKRRNLNIYGALLNTSIRFQQVVKECDFILIPSREDAQPGTYVEMASIGLLPITTYTSGYSLSFPDLIHPNTPEHWSEVIEGIQSVDNSILLEAQGFIQHYLSTIHQWYSIERQILFYLQEFILL